MSSSLDQTFLKCFFLKSEAHCWKMGEKVGKKGAMRHVFYNGTINHPPPLPTAPFPRSHHPNAAQFPSTIVVSVALFCGCCKTLAVNNITDSFHSSNMMANFTYIIPCQIISLIPPIMTLCSSMLYSIAATSFLKNNIHWESLDSKTIPTELMNHSDS